MGVERAAGMRVTGGVRGAPPVPRLCLWAQVQGRGRGGCAPCSATSPFETVAFGGTHLKCMPVRVTGPFHTCLPSSTLHARSRESGSGRARGGSSSWISVRAAPWLGTRPAPAGGQDAEPLGPDTSPSHSAERSAASLHGTHAGPGPAPQRVPTRSQDGPTDNGDADLSGHTTRARRRRICLSTPISWPAGSQLRKV